MGLIKRMRMGHTAATGMQTGPKQMMGMDDASETSPMLVVVVVFAALSNTPEEFALATEPTAEMLEYAKMSDSEIERHDKADFEEMMSSLKEQYGDKLPTQPLPTQMHPVTLLTDQHPQDNDLRCSACVVILNQVLKRLDATVTPKGFARNSKEDRARITQQALDETCSDLTKASIQIIGRMHSVAGLIPGTRRFVPTTLTSGMKTRTKPRTFRRILMRTAKYL
eukprot:c19825_g1_i2.p1 GENE.c19825_g1_i2~~c19825_g1_i2.p1  ORF type:complete len:224 (+),score=46.68 c19825_g1_i2:557-1228(+)